MDFVTININKHHKNLVMSGSAADKDRNNYDTFRRSRERISLRSLYV